MTDAANPFSGMLKLSEKATPMSVLVPSVVEKLQGMAVGQGLELPPTRRDSCSWSHDINHYAKRNEISLKVIQRTEGGVTTAWKVL